MGSAYHILGRTFQPHQLALGTIAAVAAFAIPNPFASSAAKEVEIKAGSKEEEKFITEYLQKHAEKH
ncbi:LADA_0F05644g1_1 [Lachancea dasiensis]|uniref:LADA_0F05644g1_1 n=1 Tax=Lachancea dasiensis TaxID=1072105 RepID=A0A1G4JK16_9SACH|nr:LADA_0F05644g1_1 [Lachancea dasiensis]